MGQQNLPGTPVLERVELACGHKIDTVPGISSAQIMASRGRVCFDETTFLTFHRRGDVEPFKRHLIHALEDGRNAIVIPRPWDFMPKDVAAYALAGVSAGVSGPVVAIAAGPDPVHDEQVDDDDFGSAEPPAPSAHSRFGLFGRS